MEKKDLLAGMVFLIIPLLIIYIIIRADLGSCNSKISQENNTTSETNRLLLKPENLAGFEMPSAQGFIF